MKILLFGKFGQVGWELQRSLAPLGDVTALDRGGQDGLCGDLGQPDAVATTVRRSIPDVIVNAAAYTAVDKAETESAAAWLINAASPDHLARAAREIDALLVHYSTDYVFDGSGSVAWTETSTVNPLNAYGRSKLEGERAIEQSGCRYLVFRTSWVYAARGNNFIRTMLRMARERTALDVVNDQFGAPTGAELIADVTAHAIRAVAQVPNLGGLYHLAAGGETNWHEYGCRVIRTARAQGRRLALEPSTILPIATSQFPTPARRPANSRLNISKLEAAFGLRLPLWTQGVDRCIAELPLD